MLREYLTVACTKAKGALVDGGSGKNQEMDELEELAGKLTLSETSAQVSGVLYFIVVHINGLTT